VTDDRDPAMSGAATETAIVPLKGIKLAVAGFALALVNFTVVLDLTIANVSVPHIAGGLAISPSQGTWAITSYAVAEAITVPLSGWLASRFGTVRWLLVSLLGFGLFSFLCGMASSIEMLILFRVFQGLSGGPLMPLTQTLLTRVFPPEKVPMAMGLWAVTTISAPILGPILGGMISDDLSWPWIFFINLPVVAGCVIVILRLLPPFETVRKKVPIDIVGLLLLITWVSAFQIMLDTGREHDWFASTFVVAAAVVAAVGFVAFIIWEWYEASPVVNIRLLRDRTLAVSTIAISLAFAAFFASVVLIPLWMQEIVGYTATEAGYAMAYQGMLAVLIAPLAAFLLNRVDPRLTISAGVLWLGFATLLRMRWSTEADHWLLIYPQLLQGLGMPFFFIGLTSLSLANMKPDQIASAAGLMTFARTMSGAIATAIATTLWTSNARTQRVELVSVLNDPAGAMATMQKGGMSTEQARAMLDRMVEAQASTNSALHVFALSVIMFVGAAAVVWLAPRPRWALDPGASH
jgi:DHA2 family multidrug resistance protein